MIKLLKIKLMFLIECFGVGIILKWKFFILYLFNVNLFFVGCVIIVLLVMCVDKFNFGLDNYFCFSGLIYIGILYVLWIFFKVLIWL